MCCAVFRPWWRKWETFWQNFDLALRCIYLRLCYLWQTRSNSWAYAFLVSLSVLPTPTTTLRVPIPQRQHIILYGRIPANPKLLFGIQNCNGRDNLTVGISIDLHVDEILLRKFHGCDAVTRGVETMRCLGLRSMGFGLLSQPLEAVLNNRFSEVKGSGYIFENGHCVYSGKNMLYVPELLDNFS